MKKTYFAPEFMAIKIAATQMLAASQLNTNINTEETVGDGAQMSKGFSGSLWDDGDADAEEN